METPEVALDKPDEGITRTDLLTRQNSRTCSTPRTCNHAVRVSRTLLLRNRAYCLLPLPMTVRRASDGGQSAMVRLADSVWRRAGRAEAGRDSLGVSVDLGNGPQDMLS